MFSGDEAARGVETLARTGKACAAARASFAKRAAECRAHKAQGFSSPTEWLARLTGDTSGKAKAEMARRARSRA